MSIFKESFKPGIKTQIQTRQNALGGIFGVRTAEAMQYFNSRNAWIKMQSGVDVGGSSDLAKKYILQGGILAPGGTKRNLEIGQDSAYSTVSPNGETYRLGIRPMPGITSIDVKSKSAFGSLREVTVKYQCWDIKQLEDLELLYMRPGYTALVEWGWFPYLDNPTTPGAAPKLTPSYYGYDILSGTTTISKEGLWNGIYSSSSQNGNYDAVYGFIKNYQWSARQDGGYDCTTTIITMGEILESLKINYGANDTTAQEKGILGWVGTNAFRAIDDPVPKAYAINILAGMITEMYQAATLGPGFEQPTTTCPIVLGEGTMNIPAKGYYPNYGFFRWELNIEHGKNTNTPFASAAQIYCRLKDFVDLLNKNILIHDTGANGTRTKPIVAISIEESYVHQAGGSPLLCLSHPFQLSTDPSVCIIKNDRWKDPKTHFGIDIPNNPLIDVMGGLKSTFFAGNAANPDAEFGNIGNIYVNLGFLYSLSHNGELQANDKKEKNDIVIFDYLKAVLAGVNTALGNVANLDVMVDPVDSVARIIDVNYVDLRKRDDVYKDAFTFELHNNRSIVRSYKLESQIFPEQSTIVAIGAQAQGGALGAETNTMVDFNKGIVDRIVPKREAPIRISDYSNPAKEAEKRIQQIKNSLQTVTNLILAFQPGWWSGEGSYNAQESSKYANALKDIIQYIKSLTGDDNKNRAIIPTKLSMEIDGIGGLIIGNIFRIPDELLPRGYKGTGTGNPGPTKMAYVVTGIGHSIQNNDWKTHLDAQVILLDSPKGNYSYASGISMVANILANISASSTPPPTPPRTTRALTTINQIVLHATSGFKTGPGTIADWVSAGAGTGAHYIIDRAGVVTNYIPLNEIANHVKYGYSTKTIGIELCNIEWFDKTGGGLFNSQGGTFNPSDWTDFQRKCHLWGANNTSEGWFDLGWYLNGYRYFEKFTSPQIASLKTVLKDILNQCPNISLNYTADTLNIYQNVYGLKNITALPTAGQRINMTATYNVISPGIYTHNVLDPTRRTDIHIHAPMVDMLKALKTETGR